MTGQTITTTARLHVINSRVTVPAGTAATVIRELGRGTVAAETAKGQVFIAGRQHFAA